jgi:hypothetical protein
LHRPITFWVANFNRLDGFQLSDEIFVLFAEKVSHFWHLTIVSGAI